MTRATRSVFLVCGILVLALAARTARADRHWYATNVTSQLTMTKAESPHYVHGTLTAVTSSVPPSYYGTITIEAGATVYFDTGAGLVVNGGKLVADGYWEPITLRYNGATPTPVGWQGVSIQNGTSTKASTVRNVTISYGSSSYGGLEVRGGATPTLSGITIVGSRTTGVYIENTTVSATSISAQSSTTAGMKTAGTANVTCSSCTFSGNGGPGIDHWSTALSLSSATITNNGGWAIEMLGTSTIPSLHVSSVSGNGGGLKNGIGIRAGGISGTLPGIATLPPTITGTSTVSAGYTLTIPAGRTVYFAPNATLDVYGKLVATGTSGSRITLVGSTATPGSWAGVRLRSSLDATSTLTYTTIRYAAKGVDMTGLSRAFSNLTFEDNTIGVLAGGTATPFTLSSSTFTRNGEAIRIASGSGSVTCSACTITGTTLYALNVSPGTTGTLSSSTISGNTGYVVATEAGATFNLTGNTYSNNSKGILRKATSVSGAETWTNQGLDWHIAGSLPITSTGTLTIPAGMTVRMEPGSQLNVTGKLLAEGTSTQWITFTSLAGDTQRGRWAGIYFNSALSNNSRLRYAKLEYGGYLNSGALYLYQSTPTIDHVEVRESSGSGFLLYQSVPTIRFATVRDCTGAAIRVTNVASPPVVRDSSFTGTAAVDATLLDARFCYWGDASGPSGSGPGTGIGAPATVSFEPWLATSPTEPNNFTTATTSGREFNPSEGMLSQVSFTTAQSANWTLTFRDGVGATVRTVSGSGTSGSYSWNGTNQAGTTVAPGTYAWEATSGSGGSTAAPIRGRSILDPSRLIIGSYTVSEALFSPNGDTRKDTTRLDAALGFSESSWTLQIKNGGGVTVRTWTGTVTAISRTWDGKDDSGVLQPDGLYDAVLSVASGGAQPAQTLQTRIDLTSPVVAISTPAQGYVLSNVRGSPQSVLGTASDSVALEGWVVEYGVGTAPSSWFWLGEGSSGPVSVSWPFDNAPDGPLVLGLVATDAAGNQARIERSLQKATFSVTQNGVWEFDPGVASMAYVSSVPFSLYETITIRNESGALVRTLLNDQLRAAGPYTDLWDGKNDAGVRVPDGAYSYVASVREAGGSPFVWDRSNVFRPAEIIRGLTLSSPFDPFDNLPVGISYTLGKAHRVVVQAQLSGSSFTANCSPPPSGSTCVFSGYRPSGAHTIWWPGTKSDGTRFSSGTEAALGVVTGNFPENVTVLFGTTPVVTGLRTDPPLWHPSSGASVRFDLTLEPGANAAAQLYLIRQVNSEKLLTWSGSDLTSGPVTVPLNGRAQNALWLEDGPYTIELVITDSIGNVVRAHAVMTVRY